MVLEKYLSVAVEVMCFVLMIRRPPRSTLDRSSAASDVYKRQELADALVELLELDVTQAQRTEELRREMRDAREAHCLLYTSPSPRDRTRSRMPSSA